MRIKNPEKRLTRYWGQVDGKYTALISAWVKGQRVLDIGCGYGTTTSCIAVQHPGVECIGIDYDPAVVERATTLYPTGNFRVENGECLSFENQSFDTLIMRDALHHLYREADFGKITREVKRVIKKNGRLIILDPNVNFLLRTLRFLAAHQDEQCSYEEALRMLAALPATIVHREFNTVIDLPLSGGYVGVDFIPPYPALYKLVSGGERAATRLVTRLGLGRSVCLRYFLVADFE